ncbi:MAG: hypothetical protein DRJ96_09085 [Thermoprotei archaeon]|nr:MAG: hypothetical protein DRJ96_09085 [Thermoprotei archaeon]
MSAELALRRALENYYKCSEICWDCIGRGKICDRCPNQRRVLYWFERVVELLGRVSKERAVEIAREIRGE